MFKGLLGNIVSVNDLDHKIPSIESATVVNMFPDVFPDDLPGVPPAWEIDFRVDLELDTKKILSPPYIMVPSELKEVNLQLKDLTNKGLI